MRLKTPSLGVMGCRVSDPPSLWLPNQAPCLRRPGDCGGSVGVGWTAGPEGCGWVHAALPWPQLRKTRTAVEGVVGRSKEERCPRRRGRGRPVPRCLPGCRRESHKGRAGRRCLRQLGLCQVWAPRRRCSPEGGRNVWFLSPRGLLTKGVLSAQARRSPQGWEGAES